MNNSNEKITKINKLLNSDIELEKYINSIETTNISIPDSLEINLTNNIINRITPTKHNKPFKENTFKILKIAACTLFALIMWNYISLNPVKFAPYEYKITDIEKEDKVNLKDKLQVANNFLLTPIKFERNDK